MSGGSPRVLITGGAGLLGSALIRQAPRSWDLHATQRRTPVTACESHTIDMAERDATRALLAKLRPRLVIHTAYTMADGERDVLLATRNVADAARAIGAELVYMSTDAHLDGESAPYAESAEPRPVHEYGRWKAEAEWYVREAGDAAIIRTSLILGLVPPDPRVRWIERGLRGQEAVTLFTDEIRSPIFVEDLAAMIVEIASLPAPDRAGVWHIAGPEALSRYALGVLLAAWLQLSPARLVPAPSETSATPRPRDLRLLTGRADRELRTRPRAISTLLAPNGVAAPQPGS